MSTIEVRVPDIGDFKDVPVIEVLVKAGDTVKPEDALVTLESDKATMDVPAPTAGTVTDVKVKVGDKVAPGQLVALSGNTGNSTGPHLHVEIRTNGNTTKIPPIPWMRSKGLDV